MNGTPQNGPNLMWLWNDFIKNIPLPGSLSITDEAAGFSVNNTQTEQVSQVCRTSSKVGIKYRFYLGPQYYSPRIFAVLNHNLTGGTFDINSYTWAGYGGPKTKIATVPVRALDMYHWQIANPASQMYWEFDFTNSTTPASYIEIGRCMCYHGYDIRGANIEDFRVIRRYEFRNIVNTTAHGVRWVHKVAEKIEHFNLTWGRRAGDSLKTDLMDLYEKTHGDAHPFLYVPSQLSTDCYYVYLLSPIADFSAYFDVDDEQTGDVSIEFAEDIRGLA